VILEVVLVHLLEEIENAIQVGADELGDTRHLVFDFGVERPTGVSKSFPDGTAALVVPFEGVFQVRYEFAVIVW